MWHILYTSSSFNTMLQKLGVMRLICTCGRYGIIDYCYCSRESIRFDCTNIYYFRIMDVDETNKVD